MATEDEHQPVVVKATYADGTVSFYDSARHAHATHFDGSPVVSIEPAPGEAERVEGPATKLTAPVADAAAVADAAPERDPDAVSDKDAEYLARIDELERQMKVGKYAETSGDFVPSG